MDPFECADHQSISCDRWTVDHLGLFVPAQQLVAQFLSTFKEFPPRQRPSSFTIDQVMKKLQLGGAATN